MTEKMSTEQGTWATMDMITDQDRAWLAGLQDQERRRTRTDVLETEQGTIMREHEQREIYAWSAPDAGDLIFDIRGIKDAVLSGELEPVMVKFEIDEGFYQHVRDHGGVEPARLATVRDLDRPGICILFPNDKNVLIDGNHRVVRRYELGERTFRTLMLTLYEVRKYVCRPGQEEQMFTCTTPHDPSYRVLETQIKKVF